MPQPPHKSAAEIARRALTLSEPQRAQFVDGACANDADLREQVLQLLAQGDCATLVSSQPVPGEQAHAAPATHLKRLGSYTILGILGEGGMGMVYLAEQDRPKRTVALKVIRPGALSPRLLRRFEHESQILARLQHPGIAQVYEAATADTGSGTQPFFAMEYIRGVPLTQHVAQRDLPMRERLGLFVRVCEAVAHAHQKGVIHRDLKPGNILVDAHGQPKVLDFGVARATDSDMATATCQTEVGQLVGTIPYMSPEQIAGDSAGLDIRSDVYTLGVILYEMLAGRLPHAVSDKTIPEAVRIIREDEPDALGSVAAAFKGDIQTIVAKALEKDRARRYQSASEFAADIIRFLHDEPILARPPSRAYLVAKFARRNRALVGGVAAAVIILLAGTATTAWQAIEATRGRREAEAARKAALDEAENAQAVNEFLTDMLRAANPDMGNDTGVTVAAMLDIAAERLEQHPPAKPRVALTLHHTLSDTLRSLGRGSESLAQAEKSVAVARELYGEEDINTIEAKRSLAMALGELARFDEAEQITRDCFDRVVRLRGENSVDAALVKGELARVLFQRGKYDAAEPLLRECLAILRPSLGETHNDVLTSMDHLGSCYTQLGRFADAETQLRESLSLREKAFGKNSSVTAYSLNNLANAVQKQGRNEEAADLLRRALEIRRARLPRDHPSTLVTMQNLAVALAGMGNLEEAAPLLRESMESQIRTLGESHPKTLMAMGNLAYVLEDQDKLDDAEALFRRVVDIRRQSNIKDVEAWPQMNNLAMLLMKRGKLEEAQGLFSEILSLCDSGLPKGHYACAIFRNNYGECLTKLAKYPQAEEALLASHESLVAFFKEGNPRVTKSAGRLAALYRAWGKPELASRYEPSR
ncbi:MAG: serine/threonine protein kinase [Planctomycetes bacterium]|nr:serine/threonine protein kinase [Planctomycetota bacterium]